MHIVVVGGSDAGISAALRAREIDPGTEVTVVAADAETMRQLGGKSEGNPLDCLIIEKAIAPADALTIGLAVLATLADLCRTAEASVLVPQENHLPIRRA